MPSAYLNDADKALYGVPNATDAQIMQMSTLIDGFLHRPEGLLYTPDANGNPCYMTNKQPSFTLVATSVIQQGNNVVVIVSGAVQSIGLGSTQSGQVAVLDRANPSSTESCIVISVNTTTNTLILSKVQFAHNVGCLLDFGMSISEERTMPQGRPITMLSRTPVRLVLGGQGQYGYARRSGTNTDINEYNMLAAITKFGGPPIWEIFDQTKVGFDPATGRCWLPAGIMLAYYTDVVVTYIAGWTYDNLPAPIKYACAGLISSSLAMPINGGISRYQAGDTAIQRFASTYFDSDTAAMLEPYKAREFV